MSKDMTKKGRIPLRSLKSNATFSHNKFANKLAMCNQTGYATSYLRDRTSLLNPALVASQYEDRDAFRHDYLLYNVLRKFNAVSKDNDQARSDAAFESFNRVDENLSALDSSLNWHSLGIKTPVAHRVLWRASRKIAKLLGNYENCKVLEFMNFSNGATMLHPKVEGQAQYKFSFENPEVTPQCARFASALIKCSPIWSEKTTSLTLVEGNRLTTVPKDASIDRVIACEPTMNMYVQKGFGGYMRSQLKKVNVDLDDQTVNQRLALEGSVEGELATVDLSAASDSISLAVCRLLLPADWYDMLLMCRSDVGVLPNGSTIRYNKISSMGNGFTFELESLLFWAITQSCEDLISDITRTNSHQCSIYGDDIVCRTGTVECLRYVLELCGFSLNVEKSFWDGPFRESCGKHYFNGTDVSPFFIRGPVCDVESLLGLCNRLRRWNRSTLTVDDPRYVDLYAWCRSFLPDFWQKPRIPNGYGDGALYGSLDEVLPTFKRGVYRAKVLAKKQRLLHHKNKAYDYHQDIQLGRGSYLRFLAGTPDAYEFESVNSLTNGYDLPVQREVLDQGVYALRISSVKVYEWLDN